MAACGEPEVVGRAGERRRRNAAFGGRALEKDVPAKYLNSPETPLFHKGDNLYNLAAARQAAHNGAPLIVVEGYVDVIAMTLAGFPQVVAPLGTALTEDQLSLLWRMSGEPVICLDGDKAGRRAARRALEACLPQVTDNKTIKFLFLPQEHDPDSYVREFGADAFAQEINEAMPLSQFLLREVTTEHDLDTPEGRARVQFDAKPLLQAMTPTALRLQIVRGLANLTGGGASGPSAASTDGGSARNGSTAARKAASSPASGRWPTATRCHTSSKLWIPASAATSWPR